MELGLLSKNGRYDRLNRLIDMMQEAGIAVVMHEFDKEFSCCLIFSILLVILQKALEKWLPQQIGILSKKGAKNH